MLNRRWEHWPLAWSRYTTQEKSPRSTALTPNPKGPSTRQLGTWVLGNSTDSTGFGQVYDYWVLAPLGKQFNRKDH